MNKQEIREQRWKANEAHFGKARESLKGNEDKWIVAIPSAKLGVKHMFILPMLKDITFGKMLTRWADYFQEEEAKQEIKDFAHTKLIAGIQAIESRELTKLPTQVQHEVIWYMVYHFANLEDGKYFERFDDEKAVVLDFTLKQDSE